MIEIDKRRWTALLRFGHLIDNLLDVFIIILLFVLLAFFSFSFTYSFALFPLFQVGPAIGIGPFNFLAKEMVRDFQSASISSAWRAALAILVLILVIWMRRKLMLPLSLFGLLAAAIVVSPMILWLVSGALGLDICVYPFSELGARGAATLGNLSDQSQRCAPLFPVGSFFGSASSFAAIFLAFASIPLILALLANIGLLAYRFRTRTKLDWPSIAWPVRLLANLKAAFRARISWSELKSIGWLVGLVTLVPAVTVLSILPPVTDFEIETVLRTFPEIYHDEPTVDLFLGLYTGPGRQILMLALGVGIILLVSRRWFAFLSLVCLAVSLPFIIFYVMSNLYLTVASSGPIWVFVVFGFIVGWAAYLICYPHLATLAALFRSAFSMAANRASKDVRRLDSPIVYLRPFALDNSMIKTIPSIALRLAASQPRFQSVEESIAEAAFKIAPLVALGDSRVTVEPVGAVREYISNERWENRVKELLDEPRAVLFFVGATSATKWEVDTIMSNNLIDKTIFILPPEAAIASEFFSENTQLLDYFEIDEGTLSNGIDRGWIAMWTDRKQTYKAFSAGRKDELAFKLAVTRALTEVG